MARRANNRWKGWRTSASGQEIRGQGQRTCPNCGNPFRGDRMKQMWCHSCIAKRAAEKRGDRRYRDKAA